MGLSPDGLDPVFPINLYPLPVISRGIELEEFTVVCSDYGLWSNEESRIQLDHGIAGPSKLFPGLKAVMFLVVILHS